jgi:ketosteroid isomerase-like protein
MAPATSFSSAACDRCLGRQSERDPSCVSDCSSSNSIARAQAQGTLAWLPDAAVRDTPHHARGVHSPDLVELARRRVEATGKRDLGAMMVFHTPDAVWDTSPMGMGTFEGQAAIREFAEDWLSSYEDWELQMVEAQDLGNGVGFAVLAQAGRLVGSSSEVKLRYEAVSEWEDGKIGQITNDTGIDKALAAAERLAEERG